MPDIFGVPADVAVPLMLIIFVASYGSQAWCSRLARFGALVVLVIGCGIWGREIGAATWRGHAIAIAEACAGVMEETRRGRGVVAAATDAIRALTPPIHKSGADE